MQQNSREQREEIKKLSHTVRETGDEVYEVYCATHRPYSRTRNTYHGNISNISNQLELYSRVEGMQHHCGTTF